MSTVSADDYKLIFEDHRVGAAIFEDLYRRFASNAKVHTDGGIDAVLKTYRASAHREVIEFIARQINRANGVTDPNEDGNEVTT